MRKVKVMKFSMVAAAVAAVAMSSIDAKADSASGTANAAIATALTVSETTQMDFGKVTGDAGTVVIPADGSTVTDTGVTRLAGNPANRAVFTLAGEANAAYTISSIADTTATGPGTAMPVTNFTTDATGSLDGTGAGTVNVGATLTVGASQTSGAYSASYTVTVNYN